MVNGFYSLNFKLPEEIEGSGGVAILLNGKVYGGDSSYSYQGTYLAEGALLKASIHVSPFNEFLKSIFSAFEDTDDEIQLTGKVDANGFLIEGRLAGIEGSIAVEGKMIAKIDP
jgi:hypothetical protein